MDLNCPQLNLIKSSHGVRDSSCLKAIQNCLLRLIFKGDRGCRMMKVCTDIIFHWLLGLGLGLELGLLGLLGLTLTLIALTLTLTPTIIFLGVINRKVPGKLTSYDINPNKINAREN